MLLLYGRIGLRFNTESRSNKEQMRPTDALGKLSNLQTGNGIFWLQYGAVKIIADGIESPYLYLFVAAAVHIPASRLYAQPQYTTIGYSITQHCTWHAGVSPLPLLERGTIYVHPFKLLTIYLLVLKQSWRLIFSAVLCGLIFTYRTQSAFLAECLRCIKLFITLQSVTWRHIADMCNAY